MIKPVLNDEVDDNLALAIVFSFFIPALCRNGKQIDFLGMDENYNFDIQQISSFGKIKTIKPVSLLYHLYNTLCPHVKMLICSCFGH